LGKKKIGRLKRIIIHISLLGQPNGQEWAGGGGDSLEKVGARPRGHQLTKKRQFGA